MMPDHLKESLRLLQETPPEWAVHLIEGEVRQELLAALFKDNMVEGYRLWEALFSLHVSERLQWLDAWMLVRIFNRQDHMGWGDETFVKFDSMTVEQQAMVEGVFRQCREEINEYASDRSFYTEFEPMAYDQYHLNGIRAKVAFKQRGLEDTTLAEAMRLYLTELNEKLIYFGKEREDELPPAYTVFGDYNWIMSDGVKTDLLWMSIEYQRDSLAVLFVGGIEGVVERIEEDVDRWIESQGQSVYDRIATELSS